MRWTNLSMKYILFAFVLCCLYTSQAYAGQEPAYAKWGRLAVMKTKEEYPQAYIIDYLHIGRDIKEDGTIVERFKLWLREGGSEYGVFVSITFDVQTEQVVDISFQKTWR